MAKTEGSQAGNSASLDLLDSIKNNSNNSPNKSAKFCGRFALVGKMDASGRTTVLRTFCNVYGCGICGKRKRYLLTRAIQAAMEKHALKAFATLTLKPGSCAAKDSARYIKAIWNMHRIYQRRHLARLPSFVSIVEFQKNGNAHLHVLLSEFVDWKWLSNSWQAVGGGFVHIRRADQGACRYISKYLTKAVDKKEVGNYRRVCTSRDIKLRPKISTGQFTFEKSSYSFMKNTQKSRIVESLLFGKELESGFVVLDQARFDQGIQLELQAADGRPLAA